MFFLHVDWPAGLSAAAMFFGVSAAAAAGSAAGTPQPMPRRWIGRSISCWTRPRHPTALSLAGRAGRDRRGHRRDPPPRPLARRPRGGQEPGLLAAFVQPDGAISLPKSMYRNYETSLGLMCFAEANRDGRYAKARQERREVSQGEAVGGAGGIDESNPNYGGAGYGKHNRRTCRTRSSWSRPCGRPARARRRGHETGTGLRLALPEPGKPSTTRSPSPPRIPTAASIYTAGRRRPSPAGKTPNGGLRSYGSMTYAGLKSMIYAGVRPTIPASRPPGNGSSSTTICRATRAWASGAILLLPDVRQGARRRRRGRAGQRRRPAARLAARLWAELVKRQRADGSWINTDRPLDGKRPQPGHRLRPVDAVVLQAGEVMLFGTFLREQSYDGQTVHK